MKTDSQIVDLIDIQRLLRLLPHRYPFLLIDKIINVDADNSGIGIKNVTVNEPHFTGHFPGKPIMPGVLIIEGMAQTAAAIVVSARGKDHPELVYFTTIENAKFRKPVLPGDTIEYHAKKSRNRGNIWKYEVTAIVNGIKVAEARVGALIVDESFEVI